MKSLLTATLLLLSALLATASPHQSNNLRAVSANNLLPSFATLSGRALCSSPCTPSGFVCCPNFKACVKDSTGALGCSSEAATVCKSDESPCGKECCASGSTCLTEGKCSKVDDNKPNNPNSEFSPVQPTPLPAKPSTKSSESATVTKTSGATGSATAALASSTPTQTGNAAPVVGAKMVGFGGVAAVVVAMLV